MGYTDKKYLCECVPEYGGEHCEKGNREKNVTPSSYPLIRSFEVVQSLH